MPAEERVQMAIENWAPRFIANGVDPNDGPSFPAFSAPY
jgi:hypothetical protein